MKSGNSSFWDRYAATPRTLGQVSLSTRVPFDEKAAVSLNFTHLESFDGDRSELIGGTYSRPLFGGYFTASGFKDVEKDRYAAYVGFSVPIGDTGIRASTSARTSENGTSGYASLSKSRGSADGDYGWGIAYEQSDKPRVAAYGGLNTSVAEIEGDLRHSDGDSRASGRVSGAIVAADGSVFLSRPIRDAFAVVDVGEPGIPVRYENRKEAVTGRNGKAILPRLRSWERNRVSIDTENLPVDVAPTHTKETVIPASQNGVVVSFASQGDSAIVVFRDANGNFVPAGTEGRAGDGEEPFVVGFDGQAFINGLRARNSVTLTYTNGDTCRANFGFKPKKGEQVVVDNVRCGP